MNGFYLLILSITYSIIFNLAAAESSSSHRFRHERPIPLGISGSHFEKSFPRSCYSGTLGALVVDKYNQPYILSNNHIFAKLNDAKMGDAIIQPSLLDQDPSCQRSTNDTVAALTHFIPLAFNSSLHNYVDAALAQTSFDLVSTSILGLGELNPQTLVPTLSLIVTKSGRTTGITQGIISAVDVTINIQYTSCGKGEIKTARFKNQFLIASHSSSFAQEGDGGALVVHKNKNHVHPVGLLTAGTPMYVVATPIDVVLTCFGVSFPKGVLKPKADCTPTSSHAFAPWTFQTSLQQVHDIKTKFEDQLLNIKGVQGIGIGISDQKKPVIEIYVLKASTEQTSLLPTQLEGVTVQMKETGMFNAY